MTELMKRYRIRAKVAADIVRACAVEPQNPWRYFGQDKNKVQYCYSTFDRLAKKGALVMCQAPGKGHGFHWYKASPEAVRLLGGA